MKSIGPVFWLRLWGDGNLMGNNVMNLVVQTDIFAGISAVIAYWLWALSYGMGAFCLQHKYRYTHWLTISPRERADACLNLGCFCFFAYAAIQRSFATWDLAYARWKLTTVTSLIAPIYMPFALFGLSLFLWWMCYHRHENYRRWWCNYMWTGMFMFATIVYIF